MKYDLNYAAYGDGPATIVWIHGFGGNLKVWNRTLPAFQKYRHILFDWMGHGDSKKDVAPEKAVAKTVESAEKLIREEANSPLIWIGHSFAGNLISSLINRFEDTKGAIFLDCSCLITEQQRGLRKVRADEWLKTPDYGKTLSTFYDVLIGPNADNATRSEIQSSLEQTDAEFLLRLMGAYNEILPRPERDYPVYLLEAEHFSAKDASFIEYYPNAKREVLNGAYHFFFYTEATVYREKMADFVARIPL